MGKIRGSAERNAWRVGIALDRLSPMVNSLARRMNGGKQDSGISGTDCGFIILTDQRSGSHYLMSLIDSHPGIACAGEVLSTKHRTPRTISKFLEGNFSVIYDFENQKKGDHNCIGFIVHGHQLDWNARRKIMKMKSLKIIFLERENLLRRYISLQSAETSGNFMRKEGQIETGSEPQTIDPKKLQNDIMRVIQRRKHLKKMFSGNRSMTITYEQLCSDEIGTVNTVFDFLSVPRQKVRANTLKQMNKPLKESVKNYESLKSEFNGKPWDVYFDE